MQVHAISKQHTAVCILLSCSMLFVSHVCPIMFDTCHVSHQNASPQQAMQMHSCHCKLFLHGASARPWYGSDLPSLAAVVMKGLNRRQPMQDFVRMMYPNATEGNVRQLMSMARDQKATYKVGHHLAASLCCCSMIAHGLPYLSMQCLVHSERVPDRLSKPS